ncbi:MAG TPA: hypothetical protein VIZ22_06865 [Candidatus Limnocylindrales bacterium]
MPRYAAFARIEWGRVSELHRPVAAPAPPIEDADGVVEWAPGSAPASPSRIHAVLTAAREQWAMTTFYLFDANSWR